MTPELNVTLNIAQLIMLGGVIWGLARMSKSVDVLTEVTDNLVKGLEKVEEAFAKLLTRVAVLEERTPARRQDRAP